jgi:hypothetical protein
MTREVGYLPEASEDLTKQVIPHVRAWFSADSATARAGWRRRFTHDARGAANFRAHERASRAFALGLTHGYFEYFRYGAVKPAVDPGESH